MGLHTKTVECIQGKVHPLFHHRSSAELDTNLVRSCVSDHRSPS
jgi:hypothetical protein